MLIKAVARNELFTQMPPATFGKNGVLGVEFKTGLEGRFLLTVGRNPHIAGGNPFNASVFMVEDFSGRKTRKHLSTQLHRLLTQPGTQISEGDDVVAMVVHGSGNQWTRKLKGRFAAAEVINLILGDGCLQGSAPLFPIRKQLRQRAGFENCSGEDMSANF